MPFGTPLANLDMEIKDTDTGINSIFTMRLEDPSGKFSIDPVRATGHTAVSLKINKVGHTFIGSSEKATLQIIFCSTEKTL